MANAEVVIRRAPFLAGVCWAALGIGCATSPWPDEPGLPVTLSQAANVEAGDAFLAALTAERRAAGLPAPLVTPRYQPDIRSFANDLQAGKISVAGALRAIDAWGRAAYQRPVASWVVDCGGGAPQIPPGLAKLPAAVVSYAAARFRPQSLPREQCAVLVVSVSGSEAVRFEPPK